jgi:enoyl-CoA hydratase/carnithine racemase
VSSLIATCIEDGVGIITFNRPEKHNALDDELFEQFDAGLTWAQEAQAVWCVLLLGEGKSFSSGRDTRTLNWPTDASPYTLRQGAFHAALRSELRAQTTLSASDDHHEAVEALAAKRRPNYTGR